MTPATTPRTPATAVDVPVEFRTELLSDPVGAEITASIADRIPGPAADALLADVREQLADQQGNLIFQAVRVAHGTLRSYGKRNDYQVEPITESVEIDDVRERGRSITVRVIWTHDAAQYFQFGVSAHTINGRPILSFIWEDAPQEVREMFANTERVDGDPRVFFRSVDHPGIPGSRYVQAAINWLRQEVR